MNEFEDYRIFMKRKFIDILDGDVKFDKYKFTDGVELPISMPYLNGIKLCELSREFGLLKFYSWALEKTRWNYLKDLVKFCIDNENIEDLISYLFRKEAFSNMFKEKSSDEYEKAYQYFVKTIVGRINILLQSSKLKLVNNGDIFTLQKLGENLNMHSSEKRLKKNTEVFTAFNKYILEKKIGEGGNGQVWEAKDENGEKCAIKFLERKNRSSVLKRFENETFFCVRHSHENILQILDYGAFGNEFIFYVMPLYDETLRNRINVGIKPDDAIEIFIGIMRGLSYTHENGVIHRDIKPENILLNKNDNKPVIADFGIAHFENDDLATIIETKKTDRMANFMYAAPEQRKKGGECSPQTDIYAAALLLNEMFTNEIPQAGGYKKISDMNKEYEYLDNLFEEMYKQNPQERLYPENKILIKLKSYVKKAKIEKKIINLESPDDIELKVEHVSYENGKLIFDLKKEIPNDWFVTLRDGMSSYKAILGYEPHKMIKIDKNYLAMPLKSGEREITINDIVKYVKQWVNRANKIYNLNVKKQIAQELQRQEDEKKRQLEKLAKEQKIKEIVSSL
ncbi:Protein kinase domain-containing protein [Kandleria vitulina]|uniref:serine/threonine-protein kinase n=1 Tax=Kandleria vitulina TaxID=1630 RepID=UPI0008C5B01F|nr:serine/threonine-protein kinase [Kandleria vitulina]SEI99152.1 Protein kinase domain-containing protein [Kandleria vitulina]